MAVQHYKMQKIARRELYFLPYPVSLPVLANFSQQYHDDFLPWIACPEPSSEALRSGRVVPIKTRHFDAKALIESLPSAARPELIWITARDLGFRPERLEEISCPKILKLGDTNHREEGALSDMIRYAKSLRCDYHYTYQGAHHLHFFEQSGVRNCFWLPPTFMVDFVSRNRAPKMLFDVCFRGSLTNAQRMRKKLLDKIATASDIKLDIASKPYLDCFDDYAAAHISFNSSGNGDLNRRVFEVPMATGFLLTDRISSQSGLYSVFDPGRHIECYDDADDMLAKIRYYLANPRLADEIAAAGHRRLMDDFNPDVMRRTLDGYVFGGKLPHEFSAKADARTLTNSDPAWLPARLSTYQLLQEIHRLGERLSVYFASSLPKEIAADADDLPRCKKLDNPAELMAAVGSKVIVFAKDEAGQIPALLGTMDAAARVQVCLISVDKAGADSIDLPNPWKASELFDGSRAGRRLTSAYNQAYFHQDFLGNDAAFARSRSWQQIAFLAKSHVKNLLS